jgi:hypothetical protein
MLLHVDGAIDLIIPWAIAPRQVGKAPTKTDHAVKGPSTDRTIVKKIKQPHHRALLRSISSSQ